MFVVVSRGPEFSRAWAESLRRRGEVRHALDMNGVPALLDGKKPDLVIVDAGPADTISPALIQDWSRRCGKARMLLADTDLAPLDELSALAAGAVGCCDAGLQREELERIVDVVLN